MDAHLFRLFCQAAEPLLREARIEKIYELAPGHLRLDFYGAGLKRSIYCRFGRKEPFIFISAKRMAAPASPSAPIMRLRKYCADKRVNSLVCQFSERKLWLMTGAQGEKTIWLCLDLANGPELRFLTEAELPQADSPKWPGRQELAEALENWREWPLLTPPLRKTLLTLDDLDKQALLADLADGNGDVFLYLDKNGGVAKAAAWPLPKSLAADLQEEPWENHLEALEKAGADLVFTSIAASRQKDQATTMKRREKHLRKLLAKFDEDEKRLNAMLALEKDAKALAGYLWQCDAKAKVEKVIIPDINGGEGHEIIMPRPRLNIGENMEKMFSDVRRAKRGLAMQKERRAVVEAELASLSPGMAPQNAPGGKNAEAPQPMPRLPFKAPKHVQPFVSSDGFTILRGRDAKGNLAALRKASGHDIWVHVENGPGAHVIIRRPHPGCIIPERTLIEAGTLAANKSWLSDAATASAMYAEARHVKPSRSGPAGKVIIDKIMETRITPVDPALDGKLIVESG